MLPFQGKIARSWCRRAYLSVPSGLDILFRWDSSSSINDVSNISDINNFEMETDKSVAKVDGYVPVPNAGSQGAIRDIDEVRSMTYADLKLELENILCGIMERVGGEITLPVDVSLPLVSLGMDSMSIIQFKGVLDNRYPDQKIIHLKYY